MFIETKKTIRNGKWLGEHSGKGGGGGGGRAKKRRKTITRIIIIGERECHRVGLISPRGGKDCAGAGKEAKDAGGWQ